MNPRLPDSAPRGTPVIVGSQDKKYWQRYTWRWWVGRDGRGNTVLWGQVDAPRAQPRFQLFGTRDFQWFPYFAAALITTHHAPHRFTTRLKSAMPLGVKKDLLAAYVAWLLEEEE